jgi:hypothetical protein
MTETKGETIKGRVGNFVYGYNGPNLWFVRDRRTNELVAVVRSLNEASRAATRANGGIR